MRRGIGTATTKDVNPQVVTIARRCPRQPPYGAPQAHGELGRATRFRLQEPSVARIGALRGNGNGICTAGQSYRPAYRGAFCQVPVKKDENARVAGYDRLDLSKVVRSAPAL